LVNFFNLRNWRVRLLVDALRSRVRRRCEKISKLSGQRGGAAWRGVITAWRHHVTAA
jgi:hypothetical protein